MDGGPEGSEENDRGQAARAQGEWGIDRFSRLPDEVLDLVFNGADSRGAHFIHPTQRVFLAPVCRRWRRIVADPSPRWVRGHLTREAMALDRCGGRKRREHMTQAFIKGGMLTASGIVLFLRAAEFGGTRWSAAENLMLCHACHLDSSGLCIERTIAPRKRRRRCREYRVRVLVRLILGRKRIVSRLRYACAMASLLVDGTVDAYYGPGKVKYPCWRRDGGHAGAAHGDFA
jgi:hypothetical protein